MDKHHNFNVQDLRESHYELFLGDFTFRFSTKKHMERYISKFEKARETAIEQYTAVSSLYKVMSICEYSDLCLYCEIERKGFSVSYKGVDYTCVRDVPVKLVIKSETNTEL